MRDPTAKLLSNVKGWSLLRGRPRRSRGLSAPSATAWRTGAVMALAEDSRQSHFR
jgi:hypothetical protein